MRIFIKHMVSLRCKLKVKEELNKLGIDYLSIDLGVVELTENISPEQHDLLKKTLLCSGLELMEDKKAILVERVKNIITKMIHESDELPNINFSDYLSEQLDYDYTYLSNIFTEVKGITIQQYIINNKIERVKELLLYDEMNLTEISYLLHYSSVAHLSNQFRKVTGLTPSFYKQLKLQRKENLENL
ncbi:MAG: helix-turn-helix transcriptional regulator [Cyclobacteriaceae bacterium]|nr:helix-turn-helix transcriptional regulator [Cyclobacteriaceae bacterium]